MIKSLLRSNIDAVFLDLNKNNINEIERIAPDRVFNILHGKGGEDGVIQSFFESMPKLSHTVKVTNPNTKVESDVVLEGLASFFG